MKTTSWMFITVAAMLVFPTAGMSQSATSKPKLPSGYISIGMGYGTYEELLKVCELTEEQQKKIQDIESRKTRTLNDAQLATKAAQEAVTKAQAEKDNDAMTKAMAQYAAASKPMYEGYVKAKKELDDVLTREQKAKWQEYTILKGIKMWYQGVKFSDEQWDKIMDAYEKLAKDPKLQHWDITMKLNAKIEEILTPEQRAKRLLATRYAMMDKVVQFTDEQVKKLVKIEEERAKETARVQEATAAKTAEINKAVQEAYKAGDTEAVNAAQKQYADIYKGYNEANKKYDDQVQSILTDKQKAAWQEQQKSWQNWRGGQQPPGGSGAPDKPMTPK